jgi:hypothetical protein
MCTVCACKCVCAQTYVLGRTLGSLRMVSAACTMAMGVATYTASGLESKHQVSSIKSKTLLYIGNVGF